MKYIFNCALTALAAFAIAILTFLFVKDGGLIGGSIFAGVCSGASIAISYALGGMMSDNNGFKGKELALMLICGIVAGVIGGLIMLS